MANDVPMDRLNKKTLYLAKVPSGFGPSGTQNFFMPRLAFPTVDLRQPIQVLVYVVLKLCFSQSHLGSIRLLYFLSAYAPTILLLREPVAMNQLSASAYFRKTSFFDICARPVNGKYSSYFR